MSKTTKLSELLSAALRDLEDTSILDERRTWYRASTRASIHADRFCHKRTNTYFSDEDEFEASWAELIGKRQCSHCCHHHIVPAAISAPVETLMKARERVAASRRADTRSTIGSIGVSMGELADARRLLSGLTETDVDTVESAHRTLLAEIGELEAEVRTKLDQTRGDVIGWCVEEQMLHGKSATVDGVPGCRDNDIVIFGSTGSSDQALRQIYWTWVRSRRKGAAEAKETASTVVGNCELLRLSQLEFPAAAQTALGQSILKEARQIWRSELTRRFDGRFVPHWEMLWNGLATRTATRLVGVRAPFSRAETHAVVASYPHRFSPDGRLCVVLAPEVVCFWIDEMEKRWDVSPEIAGPCATEDLEVVVALWEPGNRHSSFHELSAAREAAQALEHQR